MYQGSQSRRSLFNQTRLKLICTLLAIFPFFDSRVARGQTVPGATSLETFERYASQNFPTKWHSRNKDAAIIYRVESENHNQFLRARADKQGVQIALESIFDPKQHQRLAWRWRVREFPTGADERDPDKHDAAAQVYVIFDNQYWPRVIKYIWSERLAVGTRFNHPLYGRGQVIVLRSGPAQKDRWQLEEVNFYQDYQKFFADEPGKVQGIAIITSSDSTQSTASADYDDFLLLP